MIRKQMHILQAVIDPKLTKQKIERLVLLEIAAHAWPKDMVVQTISAYDQDRQRIILIYLSFENEEQAPEVIDTWTEFLESEAMGGEKTVTVCHCSKAQLVKMLPAELYKALSESERRVLAELRQRESMAAESVRSRRSRIRHGGSNFYNFLQ